MSVLRVQVSFFPVLWENEEGKHPPQQEQYLKVHDNSKKIARTLEPQRYWPEYNVVLVSFLLNSNNTIQLCIWSWLWTILYELFSLFHNLITSKMELSVIKKLPEFNSPAKSLSLHGEDLWLKVPSTPWPIHANKTPETKTCLTLVRSTVCRSSNSLQNLPSTISFCQTGKKKLISSEPQLFVFYLSECGCNTHCF